MPLRYFITGATGFVGGHLAEACVRRGHAVSAIARPGSDTGLLEKLGAVILRGQLTDAALLQRAVEEVDVVVHCAAKVGDRGPVEPYREVNVEGLRKLLDACKGKPLERFIHLSTLGVYAPRHHYGTTETEPLPPEHMDGYTQTKVEAEQLALDYYRRLGVPVVVLRPGFIYGPRDRTVLPALLQRLAAGQVHYMGASKRALNTIFVGNLVDAVFLAVEQPGAVGQVYNLTDGETVTKERFFEAICSGLNLPRPHQRLPLWLAGIVARILFWQSRRASRRGKTPWVPPAQLKFMLLNLDFSIEKAKRELGYQPRTTFDEGMQQTIAWYREKT
jgi:nucleoside-diphosphate-sugar epimerase